MKQVETRSYSDYTRWIDDNRWVYTFRPNRMTYNEWVEIWATET